MSIRAHALALTLLAPFAAGQSRHLWSQVHDDPGAGAYTAISAAVGPLGEVYAAGNSQGTHDLDALVLSYDAYGAPRWQRSIDAGGNEYAGSVELDPAAGVLIVTGGGTAVTGGTSAFQVKLVWELDPATGQILSTRAFAGPSGQGAYGSLTRDGAGGWWFAGYVGTAIAHDAAAYHLDAALTPTWTFPGSSGGYTLGPSIAPNGDLLFVQVVSDVRTLYRFTPGGTLRFVRTLGNGTSTLPRCDSASNSIVVRNSGGAVLGEKLDPAGNVLWSTNFATVFAASETVIGLAVDANDELWLATLSGRIARLTPGGAVVWSAVAPQTNGIDTGITTGFVLTPSGGAWLRRAGHTPDRGLDFDAFVEFDSAGHVVGAQSLRGSSPDALVETRAMVLTRQGALVVAGQIQLSPTSTATDPFVAAFHVQSSAFCNGDGSAGPCPCGNTLPAGIAGGCRRGGTTLGGRLDDQGIASLASDSLRFFADRLPSGRHMLLQGSPAAPTPFQDGLLCVGGTLVRLYSIASSSYADLPPAGSASVSARSGTLGDAIAPGTTRAYQLYFRGGTSACSPGNGNLTNAIAVTWEL